MVRLSTFMTTVMNHPPRLRQFARRRRAPLVTYFQPHLPSTPKTSLDTLLGIARGEIDLLEVARNQIQRLQGNRPTPHTKSLRHQQMELITEQPYELSPAEKAMNQRFAAALLTVGISTISLLFAPALVLINIPIYCYGAVPIFKLAYRSLRNGRISSYVLDSALIVGMILGQYYYILSIGMVLNILGRKLLLQSESHTKRGLSNLFGEQPRTVWIKKDGIEVTIPFAQLQRGDVVTVSAGQVVPVDGKIVHGLASIDQHKLTGESQPVEKGIGDGVLASTIVLTGKIEVQTETTGEETVAMQLGTILNQTAEFKNSVQSRGEVVADRLTLPTLGLSALLLPFSLGSSLAVLTNTFGYKMRIFAPASLLTFLDYASQQGILVKDGRSLELLNQVDTVLFDKTGTLTLEQPTVAEIHLCADVSKEELLQYTASAERGQTHPIAKAILVAAEEQGLELLSHETARYEMGYGIQVDLADHKVYVGSRKFMDLEQIAVPSAIEECERNCHAAGHSLVMVALDGKLVGAIELHITVRPEVHNVISTLRQRGVSLYVVSGDHEKPTQNLAKALGIDHCYANMLPEDKARLIDELQQAGRSVCFVGDGINDSIALKKAHVSVSLRGATTLATDTAQVVLMDSTLTHLTLLFQIATELEVNMRRNILISTIPSLVSISGIIFLHWGVAAGIAITHLTTFAGLSNAIVLPRRRHHK